MHEGSYGSRHFTQRMGKIGSRASLAGQWRLSARRSWAVVGAVALVAGLSVTAGTAEAAAAPAGTTIKVGDGPEGLAAAGGYVYVANNNAGTVSVINQKTNKVTKTIKAGSSPNGVAAIDGRVYVTDTNTRVWVIDQATKKNIAGIHLGGGPGGVAAANHRVYVSSGTGGGSLSVIDTATNKIIETIPVGKTPKGVAVGGGNVYVANYTDGTVSVVSQSTNKVTATVTVGSGPGEVAVADGNVYVANYGGTVSVINQKANKVTKTIKVGASPQGVAATNGHVYVANWTGGVWVISTATNKVTKTIKLADNPKGVTAANGHVYVTRYWGDSVSVLKAGGGSQGGSDKCPGSPFPDVTASNPHCANIVWLAGQGITKPADGKYHPADKVSRGSMTAFLFRLTHPGKSAPKCTGKPFPDVATSNVFCGYIKWAAHNGITKGYPDGQFRPDNGVTRGAMAAFMQRIADDKPAPKCTKKPFDDVAVNSTFCKPIAWMKANKITFGVGSGNNYGVTQIVNRQSMASFLHRLHDLP